MAGITKIGNKDTRVSPYLKAWIKQGETMVCGLIGQGTSRELTANWMSPFEDDSIGSAFGKTGQLAQAYGEKTTKTTLNSRLIWQGNTPHVLNLTLILYALSDAKAEVTDAISALEEFAAADVENVNPESITSAIGSQIKGAFTGRVPGFVDVNIGRNAVFQDCVITSVSVPFDGPVDSQGNLIKAEVNVSISTIQMLNKSQIAGTFSASNLQ